MGRTTPPLLSSSSSSSEARLCHQAAQKKTRSTPNPPTHPPTHTHKHTQSGRQPAAKPARRQAMPIRSRRQSFASPFSSGKGGAGPDPNSCTPPLHPPPKQPSGLQCKSCIASSARPAGRPGLKQLQGFLCVALRAQNSHPAPCPVLPCPATQPESLSLSLPVSLFSRPAGLLAQPRVRASHAQVHIHTRAHTHTPLCPERASELAAAAA